MYINSYGFLVARRKYSEYDELLWIYFKEIGLKVVIIKGINKKNNKFNGQLQLFSIIKFTISLKKGLSYVKDFENVYIIDINNFYIKYPYFEKISEFIIRSIPREVVIPNFYYMLEKSVIDFDKIYNKKLILAFFRSRLIPYLGLYVELKKCIHCKKTTQIIGFSYIEQGIFCKKCIKKSFGRHFYDIGFIKKIVAFERIKFINLYSIKINSIDEDSISYFWENYYKEHAGISLISDLKGKKYDR